MSEDKIQLDLELFKARNILIYMLWRRANMMRSAVLRHDILDEFRATGVPLPVSDEEIEAQKRWLKQIGIDVDNLRNRPGE